MSLCLTDNLNSRFPGSNFSLKFDDEKLYKLVKVFINGNWIGIAKNPEELYNSLKVFCDLNDLMKNAQKVKSRKYDLYVRKA